MLALVILMQAVFGVADPAQRFSPVPAPGGAAADPCGDRGPVGRWVKMSEAGAPQSIHAESWIDSAAEWTGKRLVVARRRDGKWNATAFDPCRNAWSPIAETRDLARAEPWASDDRERPFQPMSRDGSFDAFETVQVWDFVAKKWLSVAADQAPARRAHYAVALAGRWLLVWGGWAPKVGSLGDGAVLDVPRRSWKKMAASGAPSPRIDPTAVAWTGSRLLVWGGRQVSASGGSPPRILADGAQYDPAANRWTPMSSVNAPSPRVDATVVWTGRRLVVLGGATETAAPPLLRDGGIYDPTTDRWGRLEMPAGDFQPPRGNIGPLTRIMVAPDGRVVFVPDGLAQVAVLDADQARWSAIPTEAPGKRSSFRAFLIGRRLIVWGGLTVIAEHPCPPPTPGMPLCDPFSETAPHDDGWMMLLPR